MKQSASCFIYTGGVPAHSVKTVPDGAGSRHRNMLQPKRSCNDLISIKWCMIVGDFVDSNSIKIYGAHNDVTA
jgi:hypothetical protein